MFADHTISVDTVTLGKSVSIGVHPIFCRFVWESSPHRGRQRGRDWQSAPATWGIVSNQDGRLAGFSIVGNAAKGVLGSQEHSLGGACSVASSPYLPQPAGSAGRPPQKSKERHWTAADLVPFSWILFALSGRRPCRARFGVGDPLR